MSEKFLGAEFKRYLFEYRYEGSEWGIEIVATSPHDACERLKAITWARYQGEIQAKVPIPGGGLLSRCATWLNALNSRRSARNHN